MQKMEKAMSCGRKHGIHVSIDIHIVDSESSSFMGYRFLFFSTGSVSVIPKSKLASLLPENTTPFSNATLHTNLSRFRYSYTRVKVNSYGYQTLPCCSSLAPHMCIHVQHDPPPFIENNPSLKLELPLPIHLTISNSANPTLPSHGTVRRLGIQAVLRRSATEAGSRTAV